MKFYEFRQTNTGGRFVFDRARGITKHVVIEATSAEEANRRASEIGLNFDDADTCCGERWQLAEDFDGCGGYDVPTVEDGSTPAEELVPEVGYLELEGPHVYVHHANGVIAGYADPGPTA
ncbi:hypothetical protein ALI22I_33780 [Saccharothrix sp. ALI-22-I]|uniref:DUF7296 family protein n=1 Tax=Saccharothrix sp. ALI-22-I TaxID=1933778 RepID=UPI00097C0F02|nr:hypothetical protein [Saccharothrix sp. ALI-22-I]ONI83472.1 hypothetical protein ALI22I_33780 [Saccharothrix sp. ALI-22-I]